MVLQATDVIMMIMVQVQRQHWDPQVRLDFCSLARQEQRICRTGTSAHRSKSTIALPFFAVLLLLTEVLKLSMQPLSRGTRRKDREDPLDLLEAMTIKKRR